MTNVLKNNEFFKIVAYVILTRKARSDDIHIMEPTRKEFHMRLSVGRVILKIFLYQNFDILEHLEDHVASKYAH